MNSRYGFLILFGRFSNLAFWHKLIGSYTVHIMNGNQKIGQNDPAQTDQSHSSKVMYWRGGPKRREMVLFSKRCPSLTKNSTIPTCFAILRGVVEVKTLR